MTGNRIIQFVPSFAFLFCMVCSAQAAGVSWPMFMSAINGPQVVDCNGDRGGKAYIDSCNVCVGGGSGKEDCLPIHGLYTGSYSGDGEGTWVAAFTADGEILGKGITASGHDYFVKGSMSEKGKVLFSGTVDDALSVYTGSITRKTTMLHKVSGSWNNTFYSFNGTFTGSRQKPADPALALLVVDHFGKFRWKDSSGSGESWIETVNFLGTVVVDEENNYLVKIYNYGNTKTTNVFIFPVEDWTSKEGVLPVGYVTFEVESDHDLVRCELEAYEEVTVPYGTFTTMKIKCQETEYIDGLPYAEHTFPSHQLWYNWYAVDSKNLKVVPPILVQEMDYWVESNAPHFGQLIAH